MRDTSKKKVYQINLMITAENDDDVQDDWCFDVEVGNKCNLSPYEILTIAKDGAKKALNARKSVMASGDTH
jgi:hypothetical protein